jgi:hypothetical protein
MGTMVYFGMKLTIPWSCQGESRGGVRTHGGREAGNRPDCCGNLALLLLIKCVSMALDNAFL